jgi:hypothetical protein
VRVIVLEPTFVFGVLFDDLLHLAHFIHAGNFFVGCENYAALFSKFLNNFFEREGKRARASRLQLLWYFLVSLSDWVFEYVELLF